LQGVLEELAQLTDLFVEQGVFVLRRV